MLVTGNDQAHYQPIKCRFSIYSEIPSFADVLLPTIQCQYEFKQIWAGRYHSFPEIFLFIALCEDFFSFYVFAEPEVHFCNFLLYCPSQRSASSQVPSLVATHQETSSQLWAGETQDSNPGLQDNSLARYHWATRPPTEPQSSARMA